MKKFIILGTFLLCAISFTAQEHFSFRDIPINGSEIEVGNKLNELGYKSTNNPSVFTGKFIGEDCSVFLLTSNYTNNVYSIVINFESKNKWSSLKSDFNKIKKMYSEKYGKPARSLETFDSPYYDGDGYELSAIKNDKCNYACIWNLDNGSIMLTISTECSIVIYYSDKINEERNKKAKENSAKDEI